jgi:hypothetical protein
MLSNQPSDQEGANMSRRIWITLVCLALSSAAILSNPVRAGEACKDGDYVCYGSMRGLATPPGDTATSSSSIAVQGYIWLGNVTLDNQITSATVKIDGKPVTNLLQLQTSKTLTALAPLYVRNAMPPNTPQYFREVPIAGLLEKDRTAELLSTPEKVVRSSQLTQLWAQVQLNAPAADAGQTSPRQ